MLHVNKSIIASAEIVGPMSIGNRRKTKFKQKILSYRAEDFRRYNTKIKKARFKERVKTEETALARTNFSSHLSPYEILFTEFGIEFLYIPIRFKIIY